MVSLKSLGRLFKVSFKFKEAGGVSSPNERAEPLTGSGERAEDHCHHPGRRVASLKDLEGLSEDEKWRFIESEIERLLNSPYVPEDVKAIIRGENGQH
jgi:hypothetical protein